MALQAIDRELLDRCLARKPQAWEDFVDRFMGLVVHVVNHTAAARSVRLSHEDREDLCADVFLAVVRNDFASLRTFRAQCSLATYLTVIARRVVVRSMLERKSASRLAAATVGAGESAIGGEAADQNGFAEETERYADRDEIERLLEELEGREAEIVRLYHLDGKSYREIAASLDVPENSIGPTLSRAREKMRQAGDSARRD